MIKTMKKTSANRTPKDHQSKLEARAQMLKDHMSTTAAAVVAYQEMPGDDGDRSLQSESGEQFFARSQLLRQLPAGTQDAFGIQIQVFLSVVSKLQ